MTKLNEKDLDFLRKLKKEIEEEETYSTREPRLWVIKEPIKIPTSSDCSDGEEYFDVNNCESLSEEDLLNLSGELRVELGDDGFTGETENELDFLNDHGYEIEVKYYLVKDVISTSNGAGFFFTKEEAERHLQSNKHNYNSGTYVYCISAWNNVQLCWLTHILEKLEI